MKISIKVLLYAIVAAIPVEGVLVFLGLRSARTSSTAVSLEVIMVNQNMLSGYLVAFGVLTPIRMGAGVIS